MDVARPVSGLTSGAKECAEDDRLPAPTLAVGTVAEDHPASLTVAGAVSELRAAAHAPTSRFTSDTTIASKAPHERARGYALGPSRVNGVARATSATRALQALR